VGEGLQWKKEKNTGQGRSSDTKGKLPNQGFPGKEKKIEKKLRGKEPVGKASD